MLWLKRIDLLATIAAAMIMFYGFYIIGVWVVDRNQQSSVTEQEIEGLKSQVEDLTRSIKEVVK